MFAAADDSDADLDDDESNADGTVDDDSESPFEECSEDG